MTDQYAVFGNPVDHSLSPVIHSSFARQTGQDLEYRRQLVEPGQFDKAAAKFFKGGGRGLNITVPFKLDAYAFAGQLSKRARQAGAVNTLVHHDDGTIQGDNTDGVGLLRDILNNLAWSIADRRVLVLGAGGAARGVLAPLLEHGLSQLVVANRTVSKAEQLATAFRAFGPVQGLGFDALSGRRFDLVINATSAGLSGQIPDLPEDLFAAGAVAYDMVYGTEPTAFMAWAMALGVRESSDGLGMLVEQAAESFCLWRGVMPETGPVIQQLRSSL